MTTTDPTDFHPHQDNGTSFQLPGRTSSRLLRVPAALERLTISRSKFYELLRDGSIECIHIGRSVRIPEDAVEAYITSLRAA